MKLDSLDTEKSKEYNEMSSEQRSQIIKLCTVAKNFREDEKKVVVSFGKGQKALHYKDRILAVLSSQD